MGIVRRQECQWSGRSRRRKGVLAVQCVLEETPWTTGSVGHATECGADESPELHGDRSWVGSQTGSGVARPRRINWWLLVLAVVFAGVEVFRVGFPVRQ